MEINDNTSTEVETEVTEAEEVEETAEATEEGEITFTTDDGREMSLDDLLNLSKEDYEEFDEEVNHTGMKPLHEWLKHVPEDVRKHIANIRSSYTRKTQELSSQRQQLETQRAELERRLLETQENTLNNPMLEQMRAMASENEDLDLYSEEGIQKAIQREAAKMVEQMLAPAQEKMAHEVQMRKRQLDLQEFKSQHPDLTSEELKVPIAQMLMDRPELKLEDAYFLVKAKVDATKAQQEREAMAQQKNSRKEIYSKTSTGSANSTAAPPKFKNAWEAFQWHKQNS